MPLQPRHTVAALATAFIVGTVGGGILLSGGGDSASGSSIPFNPGSASEIASPTPTPKAQAAGGFTAEAVRQGSRVVITGEGAEPGANLVVQRKESGGWQDFPAHAKASSDGSYSTYIITSHEGTYRLKDTGSDAASEPVDVKA
ncbi:MAG TPA: hypothetical protein VMZ00_05155 [Sporichthya sp.]|nr:hypothetical protein [Sporichthya sp.]